MINTVGSYPAVSGGFQPVPKASPTASAPPSPGKAEAVGAIMGSIKTPEKEIPEQTEQEVKSEDQDNIKAAISQLNDYVQNIRRTLSFSLDESTGRTVIRVYDSETKELIREIPPEETLRLAAHLEVQQQAYRDGLFLTDQQV